MDFGSLRNFLFSLEENASERVPSGQKFAQYVLFFVIIVNVIPKMKYKNIANHILRPHIKKNINPRDIYCEFLNFSFDILITSYIPYMGILTSGCIEVNKRRKVLAWKEKLLGKFLYLN